MTDDIRNRLKVEREKLAELEEQFSQGAFQVKSGDAEAIAERARLADEIQRQKQIVRDLEEQSQ